MCKNFNNQCYELIKQVPCGRITTYKEIAKALNTKAYRAVGNAMKKNPYSPKVPCHRVVNSSGKIGGFASGRKTKIELLEKEGIKIEDDTIKDFERILYRF